MTRKILKKLTRYWLDILVFSALHDSLHPFYSQLGKRSYICNIGRYMQWVVQKVKHILMIIGSIGIGRIIVHHDRFHIVIGFCDRHVLNCTKVVHCNLPTVRSGSVEFVISPNIGLPSCDESVDNEMN